MDLAHISIHPVSGQPKDFDRCDPQAYAVAQEYELWMDPPGGRPLRVGDFSVTEFDLDRWLKEDRPCDLAAVLAGSDCMGYEVASAVFSSAPPGFHPTVRVNPASSNIALLEHLRVPGLYRKQGVGAHAVRWVQEQFGRTALIALVAWPIDLEAAIHVRLRGPDGTVDPSALRSAVEESSFRESVDRLRAFYARCGFLPAQDRVMYWSLPIGFGT